MIRHWVNYHVLGFVNRELDQSGASRYAKERYRVKTIEDMASGEALLLLCNSVAPDELQMMLTNAAEKVKDDFLSAATAARRGTS